MSLFYISFDSKVVIIKLHIGMTSFDWQNYFENSLFVPYGAYRTAIISSIIIIHMTIIAPECRHWCSLVVKIFISLKIFFVVQKLFRLL